MLEKEKEIWNIYPEFIWIQGSSFGRVRTLDRYVKTNNGMRFVRGRILTQQRRKNGYMQVHFGVNGKQIIRLVHRIVAKTFLPNPNNLPQINHKDCDRANNNVDNLEWCDASYNNRYKEKYGVSMTESQGHSLYAVNLKTLEVIRFRSQSEAGRALGVNVGNINGVLKGKLKYAKGYWFTEDTSDNFEIDKDKLHDIVTMKRCQFRPIFAINLFTLEVSRFQSQMEASRELGAYQQNIYSVLAGKRNKTGGFWFVKADNHAVETTRAKFGNDIANKVAKLMGEN